MHAPESIPHGHPPTFSAGLRHRTDPAGRTPRPCPRRSPPRVLAAGLPRPDAGMPRQGGLTRHVDVFIGTGGHGHTYPGATMPFGMVQLSPDTNDAGWDASSGYHIGDGSIMGFSHTHLSGTGAADMLDVLVMPAQGAVQLQPGDRGRPDINYHSQYDLAPAPGAAAAAGRMPRSRPGPGYRSRFDRSERARAARLLPRHAQGPRHPGRTDRHRAHRPASLHLPQGRRRAICWSISPMATTTTLEHAVPGQSDASSATGRQRHPGRLAPRAPVGQRPAHLFRDEAVAPGRTRPRCTARTRRCPAARRRPRAPTSRPRCISTMPRSEPLLVKVGTVRRRHRRRAAQSRAGTAGLGFRPRAARRPTPPGSASWAASASTRRPDDMRTHLLHLAVPHHAGADRCSATSTAATAAWTWRCISCRRARTTTAPIRCGTPTAPCIRCSPCTSPSACPTWSTA